MLVLPSGNCFGALFVIVTGSMSVAVALPSGMVLLSSEVASKVMSAGIVNFGGVVFSTSTIWVAFALFPASSVATHSTVVLPSGNVFDALFVSETNFTLSVAVALPIGAMLPEIESAIVLTSEGAVIFGAVVSTTSTVWVPFALLPDASVAIQSMVDFPSGNVFDALFVIVTCWMSVAVALPIGTELSFSEVASKVISAGIVSFGEAVFLTKTV